MGKSAEQGQELMDNFFSKFPKVKQLIDDSKAFLKKNGYVEDWAGRRRHLPEMNLPAYEVRYKDEALNESLGFNPFLNCVNRAANDPFKVHTAVIHHSICFFITAIDADSAVIHYHIGICQCVRFGKSLHNC